MSIITDEASSQNKLYTTNIDPKLATATTCYPVCE